MFLIGPHFFTHKVFLFSISLLFVGVYAGFHKPTKNVCNEYETKNKKKNDASVKMLLMDGGSLYVG